MSSLIVRLYGSEEQARDAATKLKEAGFQDDAILTVTPGSDQSLPDAIRAGQKMGHQAAFYAERVQSGRSLVAVDAPFTRGQAATDILNGCGPADRELKAPDDPVHAASSKAAPLSDALGMPVLSRKRPAPLSAALGLPTLARDQYYTVSELANPNFPDSKSFGFPLLSRNPTPLSSLWAFLYCRVSGPDRRASA